MMQRQNVLEAVAPERISTQKGLLQRLFAYWFDAFVYNQVWEDPRVDIAALEIDHNSRILTISSGGCNALNYLVERPESVTAVDINRYHIHLLELKLAAIKHLPDHESFFRFFGYGLHEDNIASYRQYIAPNLDDDAREFWQTNSLMGNILHGERIEYFARGGLYQHSRNGYFLRFLHAFAHMFGLRPERILEAKSVEEQQEMFERHISPFFDSTFARALSRLPVTTFGLGIPPQQLDELKQDLGGNGSLLDIFRRRTHRLACDYPIKDNYFAWQALARRYDTDKREAVPDYLKEEHFAHLKENTHRVATHTGSITDLIRNSPSGTFNRFVLLDAQDWMTADVMTDLWEQIARKGEPGTRVIFRTASAASPIETRLPQDLRARFRYESALSAELFKQDRSSIYGGFHLYVLER